MPAPPKGSVRDAAQRIEQGIAHYAKGDLSSAISDFEGALQVSPDHPRALEYLNWARGIVNQTHRYFSAEAGELSAPESPSLFESTDGRTEADFPKRSGKRFDTRPSLQTTRSSTTLEPSDDEPMDVVTNEWPQGFNGSTSAEPPLEQLDSGEIRLLELEAEPTPNPRLSPLSPLKEERGTADAPPSRTGAVAEEADPLDEPNLSPLEVASDAEESAEETGIPTNPFIKGPRLSDYAGLASRRPSELQATESPAPLEGGFADAQLALDQGELDAALELAERAIAKAGGIDAGACRAQHALLQRVYEAVIGSLQRVPAHGTIPPNLEPRSAFLLSRLDGSLTVEDLLDVSGMARVEALGVLAQLVRRGAVILK